MTQAPAPFDEEIEKAIRIHARRLVGVAGFTHADGEDIRQDMRLELLRKLPRFDPRRAQRSTFVARVLERKAGELLRRRSAEKRDRRREAYSLDATVKDGEGRVVARAQLLSKSDLTRRITRCSRSVQYRRSLRDNVARALAALPEEQRALCRRIQRVGLKRLRQRTGMSPDTLAAQVRQIRRHLMQAGMHAYLED